MKKKLIITTLLTLTIGTMLSTKTQAGYQSIPTGTVSTAYASTWVTGIRGIESASGGMGLSESINTSSLLATTEANNVDVHLQKNTEYGAVIILATSNYGKQGNGTPGSNYVNSTTYGLATSTGNKYGIYELGQVGESIASDWVAGGGSSFLGTSINPRYIDRYTTSETSYKKGDATYETKEWQGSNNHYDKSWISTSDSGFLRGGGSIFYYGGFRNTSFKRYARACVVSGVGF